VLHTRSFRDTSLLVDLFTLEHGRVNVIARGARSAKAKLRGLLLPFVPLLVSWSGKTDLMTLGKVETNGFGYNLVGTNLLSGLYINELLVRLLARHDPHPNIFTSYQNTLNQLQNAENIQAALRLFEKQLLNKIGYGLTLTKDVTGQVIKVDNYYCYEYEHGFVRFPAFAGNDGGGLQNNTFSGKSLLGLYNNNLTDPTILNELKNLMRLIFNHLLADRPIKSRELMV
jgi:DNA repair protein RecO (recombination protein O)